MTSIDPGILTAVGGFGALLLGSNGLIVAFLNRKQSRDQAKVKAEADRADIDAKYADTDRKQIDNAAVLVGLVMTQLADLKARSADSEKAYTAQLATLQAQHADCEKRYTQLERAHTALRDDLLILQHRLNDMATNKTPQPKSG